MLAAGAAAGMQAFESTELECLVVQQNFVVGMVVASVVAQRATFDFDDRAGVAPFPGAPFAVDAAKLLAQKLVLVVEQPYQAVPFVSGAAHHG